MHDQPIHLKPPILLERYRCQRCEGRRRVWSVKASDFVPCPACNEPEPARKAA